MTAHGTDADLIRSTRNSARFFTENRHVSWVLLVGVIAWGTYGYVHMPKRKDPIVPVRVATAVTPWPGIGAEKVEQLVTRAVEERIAQNSSIHPPRPWKYGIKSLSLPGLSIVQLQLDETAPDTEQEFSDINLRLDALNDDLPAGAGPVQFDSGFGDTAALMLTVASPVANDVEVSLRARSIARGIERVRSTVPPARRDARATVVAALPWSLEPARRRRVVELLMEELRRTRVGTRLRGLDGPGFVGIDLETDAGDGALLARVERLGGERLGEAGFHLDFWAPIVVRNPAETESRLSAVRGAKYTYRELDDFTDLVARRLEAVPQVSKVSRSGVLDQWVTLLYSQEELASYGVQPADLKQVLAARNVTLPGGTLDVGDTAVLVDASAEFSSASAIGDVMVTSTASGSPVYLRSMVDVVPGYQNPPRFLNFYTRRAADGTWRRMRAVSLAVYMREDEQISEFGASVDAALGEIEALLPEDLVLARTSNQPRQVRENIGLFMEALYEALALVVFVALLGFREWRSAALMMFSIPLTLALTFGMISTLGINLQQVSIATLIIALGLLVDDPVVAGDAIKRELAAGKPRGVAAWLGPTKLAHAILFATITNVAAYLPFLLLSGNSGQFLHSLPVVMACTLIASRVVSMSFVPLLGYYLLRPTAETPIERRRAEGLTGLYYRIGGWAIDHRRRVIAGSLVVLVFGAYVKAHLPTAFFPEDVQYLSYVDLWVRNDAPLPTTNDAARRAEAIVRDVAAEYAKTRSNGKPVLKSITTFVGGGAPRFWFTVTPKLHQINYAQLVVELYDKDDTPRLIAPLQRALSSGVPGAWIDARQLQTNPVPYPVRVFVSGHAAVNARGEPADIRTLRQLSRQVAAVLRAAPNARRVRDDWGGESLTVRLSVDPDRAALAGVTNQDAALSAAAGLSGMQVGTLDEGNKQIPIMARLRPAERAQLSDLENLYVMSSENTNKIPLGEISSLRYGLETQQVRRRDHFRTIGVFGFPAPGALASQVMSHASAGLEELRGQLPPGYTMEISGEQAKQKHGFRELMTVMAVSITAIYLALTLQFRNAVKPLMVFAGVPYGVVGAFAALAVMGTPFSYMAFLGIVSLIGVIVSHVILLFDFIEVMRERGEPLREALLDAGIIRLRPVMITIGATVLALVPLAIHGGPLWQPLCYAQVGGLLLAFFVTLLLVPVIYSIFVLDLGVVKWGSSEAGGENDAVAP